ncbi:MAG TPA: MFS transporter [Gemmatimonadaceae bacterium]|nr:MFS transporter [Gemmatimonadaceae bacterium]
MRLPRTVVALGAVSLLTDLSSEMIYPLLPVFLSTVLGAGPLAIGAIEGAAESIAALLKLASGWWSDRLPRRKPLVIAGYGIASVVRPLIGLVQSVGQVLAIRLADRAGKGIRGAPRDALIADAVDASQRGRAFGFHRAADHAGAVAGPLVAFALLAWVGVSLRTVFLLAAIPAAAAMIVLIFGVRESARESVQPKDKTKLDRSGLSRRFWAYLGVLLVFTLGNSTDALLILRANELGVSAAIVPILWAVLHVVKSVSSTPGGVLSDRLGRRPLIVAGWLVYAAVYLGFAYASETWHAWALFVVYGLYFGMTEGVEKALVADLVPARVRGAAFGWYNLTIGLAALPASLLFGGLWQAYGADTAFITGAGLALVAAVGLTMVTSDRRPVTGAH